MKTAALLLCAALFAACASTPPALPAPAQTDPGAVQLLSGQAAPTAQDARLSIPNQLRSAIAIDKLRHTVTLPLHRGQGPEGKPLYFVVLDSSDLRVSVAAGLNWAPKLRHALGTRAVQRVSLGGNGRAALVRFSGNVDFRPARRLVAGPDLFPLDPASTAGALGDAQYSPLITAGGGLVFNAPVVANSTGLHDKVVSIDERAMRVTLRLTAGFYEGRDVLYLSTESSVDQIASLESTTYAPNLDAAPRAGDSAPASSAREPIIPVVNGPMGVNNPERQGLRSAVAGEGDPLNIIREEPECSDPQVPANCSALEYSPLWDVHPVAWTDAAIQAGLRHRLRSHEEVISLFHAGQLVSAAPDGPANPDVGGVRAAQVIVNCPPVFVAPK